MRKGGIADDEVAGQIFPKKRQRAQHAVVDLLRRVAAQSQLEMRRCGRAANEAVRPHVVQKPGQPVMPLARAVGFIDSKRAALVSMQTDE